MFNPEIMPNIGELLFYVITFPTLLVGIYSIIDYLSRKRITKHKIAHAQKAIELGAKNVAIILPFKPFKYLLDSQIKIYSLPRKVYRQIVGKSAGMCYYDADELSLNEKILIIEAGPKSDRARIFNQIKYVLEHILTVVLSTIIATKAGLFEYSDIFVKEVVGGIVIFSAIILIPRAVLLNKFIYGFKHGAKKLIESFECDVDNAMPNTVMDTKGYLTDRAIIDFSDRYDACLNKLKNKNVRLVSAEEKLKLIEELGYKPL